MALEAKDVVSIVATLSTIVLFLTGVQICMKIRRQGNTNNVSVLPFLVCTVSCTVWLKYSILKADPTLIIVNLMGAILEASYVLIFYLHELEKAVVHRKLVLAALFVFPVLTYFKFYVDDVKIALGQLGLICCCCSVTMYGSPLGSLVEVIRTKSTASMAFPLCLANFLVALEWAYYGRIVMDRFIMVPNIIGSFLGFIQLLLFYCYSGSSATGNQPTAPVRNV